MKFVFQKALLRQEARHLASPYNSSPIGKCIHLAVCHPHFSPRNVHLKSYLAKIIQKNQTKPLESTELLLGPM